MERVRGAHPRASHASRAHWLLYGLGVSGVGFAVAYGASGAASLGMALEVVILVSLSALIVYSGYDLSTRRLSSPRGRQVLWLTFGGTAAFVLLAVAVALAWELRGDQTVPTLFMAGFAAVLGATMSARAALYAAQTEEELDRSAELTKLLRINQRVLRHNLRNELNVALGNLEQLTGNADATEGGATDRAAADITRECRQIRESLERLLETSNRARQLVTIWETDDCTEFDLADLLADRVACFHEESPDVPVAVDVPEDYRVRAHPSLPTAIDEALENAAEHGGSDVSVTVTIDTDDAPESMLDLEIADTGPGFSGIERGIVFGSPETPLEHSQGIGLWTMYWCLLKSGGELRLLDNDPSGTVVGMRLWRADEAEGNSLLTLG